MRFVPLLLLTLGCSDLPGLWQIEALTIGDVTVRDAGFLDFQHRGAAGSGTPITWMVRYTWDLDEEVLVPDPTPQVQTTLFNYRSYLDNADVTIEVALHTDADGVGSLPAVFLLPRPKQRRLTLEDPDFAAGPMVWELGR